MKLRKIILVELTFIVTFYLICYLYPLSVLTGRVIQSFISFVFFSSPRLFSLFLNKTTKNRLDKINRSSLFFYISRLICQARVDEIRDAVEDILYIFEKREEEEARSV